MSFNSIKSLVVGVVLIVFIQCKNNNPQSTKEVSEEVTISKDKRIEIDFLITEIPNDSTEIPKSKVALVVNKKKYDIAIVNAYPNLIKKADFINFGIPKTAVTACQVWWAGAGDYFYVLKSDDIVQVYVGWQDEQQEDEGYHWEMKTEIKL